MTDSFWTLARNFMRRLLSCGVIGTCRLTALQPASQELQVRIFYVSLFQAVQLHSLQILDMSLFRATQLHSLQLLEDSLFLKMKDLETWAV